MTTDRRLISRRAAHLMHARNDSKVTSAPGRAAAEARFERQVPAEITDPAERARRAEHLRKAFYLELGRKGAAARKR